MAENQSLLMLWDMLVEFKDTLYSSPMATPRDTAKRGKEFLTHGGTGFCQLPYIMPILTEME